MEANCLKVMRNSRSFLKKQTMAKAFNACFVAKIQNWIIVGGQTVAI